MVQLYSLACSNPVVPPPFIEEAILALQFDILVKIQLAIDIWAYFWTFNSSPLGYMYILISVSCCFDYYSFVVSFKIGRCECSNFILFFNIALDIQGLLEFHMDLRIGSFHFWKP